MGFGAPVIAANGSSLPEVTLGHAAYVPPSANANEWADAIVQELSRSRNEPQLAMAAAAVRARYQPLAVANTLVDTVKDRV
jgi:glycosyltransferase involved in cell wall biosynthesis